MEANVWQMLAVTSGLCALCSGAAWLSMLGDAMIGFGDRAGRRLVWKIMLGSLLITVVGAIHL